MGKLLSLLIGAIVMVVGLILLISWWYELIFVLRGVLPLVLIFAGIIAVLSGFSELKDVLKMKGK
ncbi:MAG: hypothetical protein GF409_05315 [Candidatus Omnitrophica bacterium]|nr:hypothetical protein [Candidatus Omnitrophota bacterium]